VIGHTLIVHRHRRSSVFVLRTPGRTSTRYPRDLRRRETCAAAGVRSDGVRARGACRQKDPLVKCDRHPLERVGRLTDYSVVPHPARDCDSRDAGASTCVCIKAFPASGVGRGPGRSNTKSRSRSGSDAGRATKGVPADVIQSQLFYFDVLRRGFCTLLLALPLAALRDHVIAAALRSTNCARRSRVACARCGCCTTCCSLLLPGVHKMQNLWSRLPRTP
jgi:hypothetical protein